VASPEQRGRITSLNLLAALCLVHPRVWLALLAAGHPADSNLPSTRRLSAGLLSSHLSQSLHLSPDSAFGMEKAL